MSKTILGTSLQAAFSISAFVLYTYAVYNQNQNWIIITALVYFLPIYISFIDDIQNKRLLYKGIYILIVAVIAVSVVYIAFLFMYLSLKSQNMNADMLIVFQRIILIAPSMCIPMKVYPLVKVLIQYRNRNFEK